MADEINPNDFSNIRWRGNWIWTETPPMSRDPFAAERGALKPRGQAHGLFRKTFTLTCVPARAPARITADSRYLLWVNGQEVNRGPARIRPRRLIVVDEELGLVYGFPRFVHRGDVRTLKIVGVPGVDTIPMSFGPMDLQAGEIFKISGGQIHEIEANGCLVPYGSTCGWEKEYGNE